jgi:zinc D-Ala-D-Ala carboxypeptidase
MGKEKTVQLSKNFSLRELTASQTAERKGIDNTPSPTHQDNLKSLCTRILQPVRDHFGRVVSVSSGYRSEALCIAIGSKISSQHAKGQAADFEIYGLSNGELADWIRENLDYDQLILEFWSPESPNSGWIHCSHNSEGNRKEYLRAYKNEGKTKYEHVL